jgi:hypothetical protein
MKLVERKIGMKDVEFRNYKFQSNASKSCRARMAKGFRAREKNEVRKIVTTADDQRPADQTRAGGVIGSTPDFDSGS